MHGHDNGDCFHICEEVEKCIKGGNLKFLLSERAKGNYRKGIRGIQAPIVSGDPKKMIRWYIPLMSQACTFSLCFIYLMFFFLISLAGIPRQYSNKFIEHPKGKSYTLFYIDYVLSQEGFFGQFFNDTVVKTSRVN